MKVPKRARKLQVVSVESKTIPHTVYVVDKAKIDKHGELTLLRGKDVIASYSPGHWDFIMARPYTSERHDHG